MRYAGRVAAETLTHLEAYILPGVTPRELDKQAETYIRSRGCLPACLNYHNFPNTVCASVNDQVVHCIPTDIPLKDGDIITIDLATSYEGYHGDTAKTYFVGNVDPQIQKFCEVGYLALRAGILKAVEGNFVSDISNTVYDFIAPHGYGVVKQFVGHGIGKDLHEYPQIPNTRLENKGPQLVNGMVICIEPILTMDKEALVKPDGPWNILTTKGDWACHWEHTVAILETGPEILTLRPEEQP